MKATKRPLDSLALEPVEFSGACPIEPCTWERPYAQPQDKSGEKLSLVMPAKTRWYEKEVRRWMKQNYGWSRPMTDEFGSLRFEAEFSSPRPSSRKVGEMYAPVKPDIDNFARAFLEALDFKSLTSDGTRLGVIRQDVPIVSLSISKRWANRSEWPGTRFSITRDGDEGVSCSDYLFDAAPRTGDSKLVLAKAGRRRFDELDDAPEWYAQRLDFEPVPWREPILYGKRVGSDAEVQRWQARARSEIVAGYGLRKPMSGPLICEVDLRYRTLDARHKNQWLVLIDYVKSVLDCLDFRSRTRDDWLLGVVENDSRIVALTATMGRVADGESPNMSFAVFPLAGDDRQHDDVQAMFDHIETGVIEE